MAESSFMSNSNSPSKDCHLPNVSMLGEVELVEQGGEEGAEGGSSGGICGMQMHSDPLPEPLLLLLEVTQTDGRPLPVGMFTACTVMQHVINLTGQNLAEVDVLNDCDTIVQMEQDTTVVHAAQVLHNTRLWDGQATEITCLLSSRQSVVNVVHERDHARQRLQRLEVETQSFQQEQQESQEQMVELWQKFGSKVKKVEELRCKVERTESTPDERKVVDVKGEDEILSQEMRHNPHQAESTTTMTMVSTQSEMKISKPLQICIFSGQEPVPKDEGNYDQWEFQVRGAIATHTENSVRAAIVNSL